MIIFNDGQRAGELEINTAVALGYFDGVHTGHRAVLLKAVEIARENGLKSVAWTLDSLPAKGGVITPNDEKAELIGGLGIDILVTESFENIRGLSGERFIRENIAGGLKCRYAVCGRNFTFGAGGKGNSDMLSALMREAGGEAEIVGDIIIDGEAVSSTSIRRALAEGKMEKAAALLGRPYSVSGEVQHGRHIGEGLGMPTANLPYPTGRALLPRGVYASAITVDGKRLESISNLGVNPTVAEKGDLRLETHILGEAGNLYGKRVKVELLAFMRPEQKFASTDELVGQIGRDIAARKTAAAQ